MTGEELRREREALGMTQAELGAALDVPGNTISRWERGTVPILRPRMLRLALWALARQPRSDENPGQTLANSTATIAPPVAKGQGQR